MRIAIVYASVTGNTKELAEIIQAKFQGIGAEVDLFTNKTFPLEAISSYDALVMGTFTWTNGQIPRRMRPLYRELELAEAKGLTTAVFGTGDRFFPHFCGAVDGFRDMLFAQTNLAVTLKVELRPQQEDIVKCDQFVDCVVSKINDSSSVLAY